MKPTNIVATLLRLNERSQIFVCVEGDSSPDWFRESDLYAVAKMLISDTSRDARSHGYCVNDPVGSRGLVTVSGIDPYGRRYSKASSTSDGWLGARLTQ